MPNDASAEGGPERSPRSDPATLLTAAAVALNQHADLLVDLGRLFAAAGHELYLVGGSVRDALLGRELNDLDFTTDARPAQLQKLLRGWAEALWDTGIEFGTIGAAKYGERIEITTFRADSYDQVSRNPEVVFGDRLEDDLVRRDFTVNAMAVRINPDLPGGIGEFHDPLGGLTALADKVLDTPSAPQVSFGAFAPTVAVPSREEIEARLLERRKEELLRKYQSPALLASMLESRAEASAMET